MITLPTLFQVIFWIGIFVTVVVWFRFYSRTRHYETLSFFDCVEMAALSLLTAVFWGGVLLFKILN